LEQFRSILGLHAQGIRATPGPEGAERVGGTTDQQTEVAFSQKDASVRLVRVITTDAEIGNLRLRYDAAYAAYQSGVMALNEAIWNGKTLTPEQLENEARSLRELTDARAQLMRALAEPGNGDPV
jgi:hypothetical protein